MKRFDHCRTQIRNSFLQINDSWLKNVGVMSWSTCVLFVQPGDVPELLCVLVDLWAHALLSEQWEKCFALLIAL